MGKVDLLTPAAALVYQDPKQGRGLRAKFLLNQFEEVARDDPRVLAIRQDCFDKFCQNCTSLLGKEPVICEGCSKAYYCSIKCKVNRIPFDFA